MGGNQGYIASKLVAELGFDKTPLWGEISITLDMQMTPPLWQKVKKN